ncbi:hypothetical protein ACFQ2B_28030 [Streptomyces stramineus]|uniref:Uncharacterized protein n=1 Tax=Streptomyces stramineus TaxID=173861 RepID=A0ABN0ZPC7_9ACTN
MSDALNIPNELIDLERAAVQAHSDFLTATPETRDDRIQTWRDATAAMLAAVAAHAAETGQSRYELEMAVKRAVRHPGDDGR